MKIRLVRNIVVALALVIVSFGIGYRLGLGGLNNQSFFSSVKIINQTGGKTSDVDFSRFWEVWNRLNRYYIDKKALDPQKMVFGAISGMVSAVGDPYTVFLPPDQNKEAKEDLGGKFQGIGAQLGVKDKKIVVIAPLKGAPAETAGLKPGDWIMKVDGKETMNWTLLEAVSKIRGEKGSKVMLTILHKDASSSADISVIRDEIKVPSVEWEAKKIPSSCWQGGKCEEVKEECGNCDLVFYIKLTRFGDQTSDEWTKAVTEINDKINSLSKSKVKGLVLDLRNNPGGYLMGSVFIASEFLNDGIVVSQEYASGQKQNYDVDRSGTLLTIPMVVLINKGSASASEIVAGALRDRKRAKLVGETTFGKGSIQEAQEMSDGSGIHITTAKWLTPSGKWVNSTGLEPDFSVSQDEAKPDTDFQLEKAIEVLLK